MKKYALITGASKGIGKAIALKFAEENINIGIVGRNKKDLSGVAEEIKKIGVDCDVFVNDISRADEVKKLAEELFLVTKHCDILVNNAGFALQKPLLELELTDWDYIQNLNLRSVFLLSKLIAPQMIKNGGGYIVNISSLGAFFGTAGMGAYGVSKAGINQLTRTMAVEWGPFNINTNAICPTIVMTDLAKSIWDKPENIEIKENFLKNIPRGRFGQPNDVSEIAYFLVSGKADYINGLSIPLEGGKMAKP